MGREKWADDKKGRGGNGKETGKGGVEMKGDRGDGKGMEGVGDGDDKGDGWR